MRDRKAQTMYLLGMLYVSSTGGHTAHITCPPDSREFEQPWAPLPWRDPIHLCRCRAGTFCSGPYCHSELEPTTNQTVWTASILGCGEKCRCLPPCTDPLNCWDKSCLCQFTLDEQFLPRNPTAPHSPRMIRDALEFVLPPELLEGGRFDPQYLNPCWRSGGSGTPLRCMPYAYIPGILKCATSALYDTLEKHPQVLVSYPKETHWWTRTRPPFQQSGRELPFSQWLMNHARRIDTAHRKGKPEIVVIEGSASLFWEKPIGSGILVPELLHATGPQTKFIVMFRDPADRLYSDYLYFSYRSRFGQSEETRKYTYNPAGFHLAVVQSISEMKSCFKRLSPTSCAWDQRSTRTVTQIQLGMYAEFIKTWFAFFPREQFLFLRQEDLIGEPIESYAKATSFLGLPPLPTSAILLKKSNGGNGTVVKKNAGNYGRGRKSMLPKTRALLNDFYKPFNLELGRLLGDKFAYGASSYTDVNLYREG